MNKEEEEQVTSRSMRNGGTVRSVELRHGNDGTLFLRNEAKHLVQRLRYRNADDADAEGILRAPRMNEKMAQRKLSDSARLRLLRRDGRVLRFR